MEYEIKQAEDPGLIQVIEHIISDKSLRKSLKKFDRKSGIERIINDSIKKENRQVIDRVLRDSNAYTFLKLINKKYKSLPSRRLFLYLDIKEGIDYNKIIKYTGLGSTQEFLKLLQEIPKEWIGFEGKPFSNDISYVAQQELMEIRPLLYLSGGYYPSGRRMMEQMIPGLHQETLKVNASELIDIGENGHYSPYYAVPELKIEGTGRTLSVSLCHMNVNHSYDKNEDKSKQNGGAIDTA